MRKAFHILIAVLAIAGCSNHPEVVTAREQEATTLSVLFTSGRYLSLKPCGCGFRPLGGVDREENLAEQWRRRDKKYYQFLKLASGPSFVPTMNFSKSQLADYVAQSTRIVQAWNFMQLAAVGVSNQDLAIGLDNVRKLEASSRFKWLSANLVDKKGNFLFVPYTEVTIGSRRIGITSVSAKADMGEVVATDPAAAVRAVLSKLKELPDTLIVLSSDVASKDLRLPDSGFAVPTILLRGTAGEQVEKIVQTGSRVLELTALDQGKSLARIDLSLPTQNRPIAFYHPIVGDEARANVLELEKKPKKTAAVKEQIKRLREVPFVMSSSQQVIYHYEIINLNTFLDPKQAGSLSALMKEATDERFVENK